MGYEVHRLFVGLEFWLVQDKYKVETLDPMVNQSYGSREVKFTTPNPEKLPVPSPDYLALHAAYAKVACPSGAADYIETVLKDAKELPVLAADGSSGDALTHLLQHITY
ncbi:hypothetical protein EST38_g13596 [Candolleomyces aberdarensis]|uniref:Uncharacterized protein n=1 Tax=Candolleomyces aberdarensis TaxID=2316362 RepID=A0A4Q2D1C4_9AGAR|nr:hypothetical protein EST38_g13596 [Candolleomyces aberdarensis]